MKDDYDIIVVGGGGKRARSSRQRRRERRRRALAGEARRSSWRHDRHRRRLVHRQPRLAFKIETGSKTQSRLTTKTPASSPPPTSKLATTTSLRRFFLSHAADTIHWLMDMGLTFHGPNPEPPNRVPRMHNVVPGAKAYVATLHARLIKLGGTVRVAVCRSRRLLQE